MFSELLFACDQCDTVDCLIMTDGRTLCSDCLGKGWHGVFAKETFDPNVHRVTNRSSNYDEPDLDDSSFG